MVGCLGGAGKSVVDHCFMPTNAQYSTGSVSKTNCSSRTRVGKRLISMQSKSMKIDSISETLSVLYESHERRRFCHDGMESHIGSTPRQRGHETKELEIWRDSPSRWLESLPKSNRFRLLKNAK